MENWYVLFTKPRNEKKVTSQLVNLGIKAYCPMITTVHQWSDRKKKVTKPLISSCVFIQSKESDRKKVFQIPGTVRYLFWLGKPAIIRNSEIETLQNWLQGELIDVQQEKLEPGDIYTLKKGQFEGQKGIVNEVSNNRLQLILVELGMKITLLRNQENSL
ncbi:UpxY family transcription antiterminator [Yeosuana sp.]|uniref:UpxY family transcription antiterminator n=1 Tax=Yeosuana sp. TaxID=2529388 RepID=UPI0040551221|tara:strand:+ start:5814 stop:6293 length:480 start_codon:yes stop_codon:yes gene_type:complete